MNRKLFALVFCGALIGAVLVPTAKAGVGHETMIVTVRNGSVDIPGYLLAPGKYKFEFTDLEHDVLRVSTADGSRQIGFFEVVPIWRRHRTESAKLDLSTPANGSVERIRDFFYPGERTGHKFVYSQKQ